MKKTIPFLVLFVLLFANVFSQKINSPQEIFKVMEKSKLSYTIDILDKKVVPKDRDHILNYNEYYRKIEGENIYTYKYKLNKKLIKCLNKAEEYFKNRDFINARKKYFDAIKLDSNYYKVMTYIAQTYGIEGNYTKAIEWYEKTLSLNYIDYLAHWFLADIYFKNGELNKAKNEITIAKILNRNNPRLEKAYNAIFKTKKNELSNWHFTPQYKLDSINPKTIKVAIDTDWMGYALVKSVWRYEPGYKKAKGVKDGSYTTLEEKECFASLVAGFNETNLKKYPEFRALKLSLEKNMIDEYIFYEVILPEKPFVAYQLSEEFIEKIKDYIIKVRNNVN